MPYRTLAERDRAPRGARARLYTDALGVVYVVTFEDGSPPLRHRVYSAMDVSDGRGATEAGMVFRERLVALAPVTRTTPGLEPILDIAGEGETLHTVHPEREQFPLPDALRRGLGGPLAASAAATCIKDVLRGASHLFTALEPPATPVLKPKGILLDGEGHASLDPVYSVHPTFHPGSGEPGEFLPKDLDLLAPELLTSERPDERTFVFLAGQLLLRLLLGRSPFPVHGYDRVRALAEPRDILIAVAREVPLPLYRVVLRAMTKEPSARIPGALALAAALEEATRELGVGDGRDVLADLARGARRG